MLDTTKAALQAVADTLPKLAATIREEGRQVLSTGDHIEVIKHFNDMRIALEQIKSAREALQEMADKLSRMDIPDLVSALRQRTGEKPPFHIEGIGTVTVSYRSSCSMIDKDMGFMWLRENGHGDLIQPTVNAQTLAAFAKDMRENHGKDLPVEIFKVGQEPYTSIRK